MTNCITIFLASLSLVSLPVAPPAAPSDHGDAPLVSNDQGLDIGDIYTFVDPNDSSFAVLIMTLRGFIVPGQAENQGFFQAGMRARFSIENTGDATPEQNIDIVFTPRTGPRTPQTATISMRQGNTQVFSFTALTTAPSATSLTPLPFVVTTDPSSNVSFFAGVTDDPFFFDATATIQYLGSRTAGAPDPSFFNRGRDTFAGYNCMSIALRMPVVTLRGGSASNVVGVAGQTELAQRSKRSPTLGIRDKGGFVTIDRAGIPAVNSVLIPFARKDEYNRSSPVQDSQGLFANDIVQRLQNLGTDSSNINLLASVAVSSGDISRLDVTIANTGGQGGTSAGAGFPNGRRLADDVIDTLLTIINNNAQVVPGQNEVDNVNANDKLFENAFPFLAPPHQPRASGTDNGTRN